MSETIAPTPERLRKGKFDTPTVDQKTERRAYRARDIWNEMLRRGEIGPPEHQAAERFEHHYLGMLGHDVRVTDAVSLNVDEAQRTGWDKHIHALDAARSELIPKEFLAMELLTIGEHDLVTVGKELSGYRKAETARAYAIRLVQGALERLAYLWDFSLKRPRSW